MILGRQHPLLKRLRLLRRSSSARVEQGALVAEGIHLAQEALAAAQDIELAVVDSRIERDDDGARLLAALRRSKVPTHEVADTVMKGLQDARSPQPVLLVVSTAAYAGRPWRRAGDPLVVVCDGIQDPGNLGSVLRSADAAGAAAFVATGACADLTHPRTVRASMGSVFRLPVERMSLVEAQSTLRDKGLRLVATVARGGVDYGAADYANDGCAVFFGGEGGGLPDSALARCDQRVTVPLHDGVESLSVGAAVAAVLFEARRRRRARATPADPDG